MWRREFIALLPAGAVAAQSRRLTADEALKDLLAGNERFMTGKTLNPRRSPADFSKLAPGQGEIGVKQARDPRVVEVKK